METLNPELFLPYLRHGKVSSISFYLALIPTGLKLAQAVFPKYLDEGIPFSMLLGPTILSGATSWL